MKILELRSENVKRLRSVHIKPGPDGLVVIGGANGAGKSSCIDSIWYALGGKDSLPPDPVRHGATEATISVKLGDGKDELTATRTITPDGKSTLKLTGKDGGKYASPQTILDSIAGNLTFDPLAFSRAEPKKQADTLKQLVGLDFSALDRQKAAKVEERVMVGREVKQLQGQLTGLPHHEDAPTEEVSIADLTATLNAARQTNQANAHVRSNATQSAKLVTDWEAHVESLKKELQAAEGSLASAKVFAGRDAEALAKIVDANESAILERMNGCEALNRKVRENRDRHRVTHQINQKQAAYDALSTGIAAIDQQKAKALAEAKFPVPSLSFDDGGVLVAGVPFQQASAAEQLRVSVAMGMALNPKLKVLLVRDGSLLDAKSLAMVAEMADQNDSQVWMERVADGDPGAIIIEDGMVQAKAAKREPACVV